MVNKHWKPTAVYEMEASPEWGPAWNQLKEFLGAVPHHHWCLVGGLMVRILLTHHHGHDIRVTHDLDVIINLRTSGTSVQAINAALRRLGYNVLTPSAPGRCIYRWKRDDYVVDVLTEDHGAKAGWSYRGHRMVCAPGSSSALTYHLAECRITDHGETYVFAIPDLLGALTMKAGIAVDQARPYRSAQQLSRPHHQELGQDADVDRHLRDCIVLMAAVDDPAGVRGHMQGSDARRLRRMIAMLDREQRLYAGLPPHVVHRAQRVAGELRKGRRPELAEAVKAQVRRWRSAG